MSFLAREVGAVFVLLWLFFIVCFVVDRWWSNGEGGWKSTATWSQFYVSCTRKYSWKYSNSWDG